MSRFVPLAIAAALVLCGALPPASSARPEHGRLLLSAERLRPGGARFEVRVRLASCRGRGGLPVQLSRNDKSFAAKHLDRHCRARFWLTVAKPTPIQAFVRLANGAGRVHSRRLVLLPPKRR